MYASQVTKIYISDESPQKRIKNSSDVDKSLACYARLEVVFKYDLRQGKAQLRAAGTINTLDKVSPFTQERSVTQRQIKLVDQGHTKYGFPLAPAKNYSFFVCHNVAKTTEVLMIASTLYLDEEEETFLVNFCNSFNQLTNTCLRNANKIVKAMREH